MPSHHNITIPLLIALVRTPTQPSQTLSLDRILTPSPLTFFAVLRALHTRFAGIASALELVATDANDETMGLRNRRGWVLVRHGTAGGAWLAVMREKSVLILMILCCDLLAVIWSADRFRREVRIVHAIKLTLQIGQVLELVRVAASVGDWSMLRRVRQHGFAVLHVRTLSSVFRQLSQSLFPLQLPFGVA